MTWSALATWTLTAMVRMQNPNGPGIDPELAASYVETASEIADASEESPLLGDAKHTAALLVVWAYHESRFRRAVEGDSGASVGVLQVWRGWGDTSIRGALKLMHRSFEICRDKPIGERAAQYAYGRDCTTRAALSRSRMREVAVLAKAIP